MIAAGAGRDEVVLAGRLDGVRSGVRLLGAATLHLLDEAILVEGGHGVLTLEHDCLDGVSLAEEAVLLRCAGGDLLRFHPEGGADLRALRALVELRATRLPELARSLRALGSRRGLPGSDHDRFFRPFLLARQRMERAATLDERLLAADAATLRDEVARVIAAFAAERHPQSPPDRRALHAELEELAEPLVAALDQLDGRAAAVRAADDAARVAACRGWAAALAVVFLRADDWWSAALPALADSRGGEGRVWRRFLRGG